MNGAGTYEAWIERAARLHPDRLAVDAPDGAMTNAQLAAGARELAAARLTPPTVAMGAAAAIAIPAGAAFAVALHACLIAGVIAVPDDLRLPEARRAERTQGCVVALTPEDVLPFVTAARTGHPSAAAPARERLASPIAGSGADAATPAVRLTTSGTTGPGTPVHLSRGALLWNAIGSAAALGQPANERWLSAMPVSHVGGLTVLTRSAIGATCAALRPSFDAAEQLTLLQAGQATITSLVPTMLGRLLEAGLHHPPGLRLVLLGGAAIAPSLVDRAAAAGIAVAATYGLSEACSQVFTAGAPLFCTQVALREELTGGAQVAGGRDGAGDEIVVRGPTLASGVAGADGWLATGDRGRRLPGGRFAVVGRLAETIVTGGENVAPTEVEAHLLAQPAVADAAVLGVADQEWGERVEARVVIADGYTLDEVELRARLRELLPPYAVPKRIVAVAELPRTANGKLLRRKLA
ncbi:MAG: AMP-binding protein [Solirubrobacteraceae bacterium]|nr:AMP-binding protein [Solirubrobacteraceae bacterium]